MRRRTAAAATVSAPICPVRACVRACVHVAKKCLATRHLHLHDEDTNELLHSKKFLNSICGNTFSSVSLFRKHRIEQAQCTHLKCKKCLNNLKIVYYPKPMRTNPKSIQLSPMYPQLNHQCHRLSLLRLKLLLPL